MKITEHLELSLPEGNDYVNIETLNENWRKIDATFPELIGLVEGRAQVVSGSYVGTGTYGEDNPNTLEFAFAPKIVLLIHMVNEDSATPHPVIDRLISPLEYGTVCAGSGIQWYTAAAWGEGGLSVSWWVVGAVGTAAASGPSYQRNHEGKIYHYIAIG